MTGKSRRSRRKKKKQRRQIFTATASQQQEVAQTYEPSALSKVAAPSVKETTPTVARYPRISTELRRIGILAGIMLTVLIILSLVLH